MNQRIREQLWVNEMIDEELKQKSREAFLTRLEGFTLEQKKSHLTELMVQLKTLEEDEFAVNLQKKLMLKNPKKAQVTFEYENDPEWIEYSTKRYMIEIDTKIDEVADALEYTRYKIDATQKAIFEAESEVKVE